MKKKRVGPYIPVIYKLITLAFVTMVLPLFLASHMLYQTSTNAISDLQSQNAVTTLISMRQSVEYRLKQMDRFQITLYDNLAFRTALPKDGKAALSASQIASIQDCLDDSLLKSDNGTSISIFFDNGQIASEYKVGYMDIRFVRFHQAWFENQGLRDRAAALNGRCFWLPSIREALQIGANSSIEQRCFSFARVLRNPVHGLADIGVMVQTVNTDFFDDTLLRALPAGCQLMIVSPEGIVVWHSTAHYIASSLSEDTELSRIDQNPYKPGMLSLGGTQYLVSENSSEYNGWRYYMMTPASALAAVSQPVRSLSTVMWFLSVLALILGVFLYRTLITKPLKSIVVEMNSMVPGREPRALFEIAHNDEIGLLYNSFVSMQKRINLLLRKVNTSHQQQLQQEILMLQAQLNPHFLYNTLDTVNWLANERGAGDICKIVQSLSEILRYILRKKQDDVKLSDEINMVRNYVFIQQFRFKNKFAMDYRIDERALNGRVERLLVQPIVENAINHGFAQKESGGLIGIEIALDGENISIHVRDNGCGMSEKLISDIFLGKAGGIGLYNIHHYMQMKYGEEYGLQIRSVPGEGTVVTLLLPYRPVLQFT